MTSDLRLLSLREQFDQSFAEAARAESFDQVDFLTIAIAGDSYAVRLTEVRNLQVVRQLVAAPSPLPSLLGMAGFRGVLTPIYDLGQLLGYGAEPAPRWLIVAQNTAPVGFAFPTFEAHVRVARNRVSEAERADRLGVRGAIRNGENALPLIHLPSLVEQVAQRIKTLGSSQER